MIHRKRYTKEFNQGAVRLVIEQGRSIAETANSLSIPAWSLSRWVRAAKADPQDPFPSNGNRSAQEQEIVELRRRVKQLEDEKQILKKRRLTLTGT